MPELNDEDQPAQGDSDNLNREKEKNVVLEILLEYIKDHLDELTNRIDEFLADLERLDTKEENDGEKG